MGFAQISLRGRALRLLSQREHSRAELYSKLTPHVQEGDDLSALLDEFESKDFINADRVAQSVLYRRSSKLGNARVLQELRSKGLNEDTVRAAAEQLKGSEHARAWQVWQRKFGQVATSPAERMKQMRFLSSRGFGGDVVSKVLRGQAPDEA